MKSYPINSINYKNCINSKEKVLKTLRTCLQCGNIPLPIYRSFLNQDETYCKNCFIEKEFDINYLIKPSSLELEVLDKLLFNCLNIERGCTAKFDINNLSNLLNHEKECITYHSLKNFKEIPINIDKRRKNCVRCDEIIDQKNHDCVIFLKKSLTEMNLKIEKLSIMYNQQRIQNEMSNSKYENQISLITEKFNCLLKKQEKTIKKEIKDKLTISRETLEIDKKNLEDKCLSFSIHNNEFVKKIDNSIENLSEKIESVATNIEVINLISLLNIDNRLLIIKQLVKDNFKVFNASGYESFKILRNPMCKLNNLTSLSLDFNYNNIGTSGIKDIVFSLTNISCLLHLKIELSYNSLSDSGVRELSNIALNFSNLTELNLNLSYNNISAYGAKELSKLLFKLDNLKSLSLFIGFNDIRIEGVKDISDSLSKMIKLTYLNLILYNNDVCNEGTRHLSNAISLMTHLTFLNLDLNFNSIEDLGIIYLSKSLEKFVNLKSLTLDLSSNKIEEVGAKELSNGILKLNNLLNFKLNMDKFKNSILKLLRKGLGDNIILN